MMSSISHISHKRESVCERKIKSMRAFEKFEVKFERERESQIMKNQKKFQVIMLKQ